MRLIDADKVEQGKFPVTPHRGDYKPTIHAYMFGWNDAIDVILNMKTADAAPVVHAKWISAENPNYSPFDCSLPFMFFCSNCNGKGLTPSDYCPNCGAKMDDERADDNETVQA